ncbi:MAG TPA: hypothetical protein VFR58_06085 [Flavisolibacter sp.]|nr:hypothetical protein [Flavisolibacter sp.]
MDIDKNQAQQQDEGTGRTHNTAGQQNPEKQKTAAPDISEVDQQEGNMQNGQLGGNLGIRENHEQDPG